MTPEQFCYWFQGFVELGGASMPTPEQWKSICEHAQTVFKKVTPPVSDSNDFLEVLKREAEKKWKRDEWPKQLPDRPYYVNPPIYADQFYKFPPTITCSSGPLRQSYCSS